MGTLMSVKSKSGVDIDELKYELASILDQLGHCGQKMKIIFLLIRLVF